MYLRRCYLSILCVPKTVGGAMLRSSSQSRHAQAGRSGRGQRTISRGRAPAATPRGALEADGFAARETRKDEG